MAMENLCKCLLTNYKIANQALSTNVLKFRCWITNVLNARSSKRSSKLNIFPQQNFLKYALALSKVSNINWFNCII